jgi:hypothetical protein
MTSRRFGTGPAAGLALILAGTLAHGADQPARGGGALHLDAGQKEFLRLEPILVTVRLEAGQSDGLPAAPGKTKQGTLRFEIKPEVKPRSGAKPLPLESQVSGNPKARQYDLLEWFAFPDKGTWSVQAVFESKGGKVTSPPVTISIDKPEPKDPEHDPMARLHHTPWTNYDTNAFCGDTFDLVKRWPKSRFAKYCHYWNGRYLQNKKEYAKAIASFRTVVEKYPDFALADAAEFGIVQCLHAQGKMAEAQKINTALRKKLSERAVKQGIKPGNCPTAVQQLAEGMSKRLNGGGTK